MSTKTQMYSEPTVTLIMRAAAESLQVHITKHPNYKLLSGIGKKNRLGECRNNCKRMGANDGKKFIFLAIFLEISVK